VRFVFDAGMLLALERRDPAAARILRLAELDDTPLVTHSGVVAQVWRGGQGRQASLAAALRSIDVAPIDEALGKAAGELMAASRLRDVVDAALVAMTRTGDRVFTSDPDDIMALVEAADRDVEVVAI
jgi:predicted nucleic acid-binding protein